MTTHAWWQLNCTGNDGGNAYGLLQLQFRTSIGGGQAATGGTATASETFDGAGGPYDLSHALANTGLYSGVDASNPQFLRYHFASAVDIAQIMIQARNDGGEQDQAPDTFDVQYSDDGTTWTTKWSVSTSGWGSGETRTFAPAGSETSTASLALTGVSFSGAGGRTETATPVTLALSKVSFAAVAQFANETFTAALALVGISIKANVVDVTAEPVLVNFYTF